MKKCIYRLCFTVCLFILLSACTSKKNSGIQYYGDVVNNDTLRICIDFEISGINFSNEYNKASIFEDLAQDIKSACSIKNIVFEILPGEGAERQTALQRLRTEIMAGDGPDVFILNAVNGLPEDEHESALLNFPEKNMEAGLFLPLDEYMENNTQFTDWNMQTKAVMNAGRSDEGQVIIPLTYTFPVLVYPENEVSIPYTSELTMQEILDNPETAELGAVLYSSITRYNENTMERIINLDRLSPILGKLADYENEELLFTENELYETLATMHSLNDDVEENQLQYIEETAGKTLIYEIDIAYFDTDMALVPLYSKDGGVTASIRSYAAVNRNTSFPEEAFSVLDYLMQEDMQRESKLYNTLLSEGIPMQNDLGQEGKSLFVEYSSEKFLDQRHFEDLLEIKEQITAVNFKSELDMLLEQLVFDSIENGSVSREDVSEAYAKMKRMMGE